MGLRRDVRVEVDELVLHGVRAEDRHAVAAAFHEELTRVLAQAPRADALAAGGDAARVDAGPIHPPAHEGPAALGAAAARAVAGRLGA